MAARGSKQELATRHEHFVATMYGGRRSNSSGAAVTDEGDVRTERTLIECKARLGELAGQKPVSSTLVRQMEKIADEAWSVDRDPALALRFYVPSSRLAHDGWVDLLVRPLEDDASRENEANLEAR